VVVRRALILAIAIVGAVAALSQLRTPQDDRPVAVVGHTGSSVPVATAPAPVRPPVLVSDTTTTMVTVTSEPKVVTSRSSTVVESADGRVTVVHSGSASASTGGNTVVGPGSASVVNGRVTAVGNSSEVRITGP
jgi:hypothetical protein